jgi:hypothetical protein
MIALISETNGCWDVLVNDGSSEAATVIATCESQEVAIEKATALGYSVHLCGTYE